MKKETMEKLDKINLLWLLEKISVGNLVRGVIILTKLFRSVRKCIVDTVNRVKTIIKEEKAKLEQSKSEPEIKEQT